MILDPSANDLVSTAQDWDVTAVIDWLMTEGRLIDQPEPLFRAVGDQLFAAGAPVDRMRFATRTIHPLLSAWAMTWSREDGNVNVLMVPHGLDKTPAYLGSPFQHLNQLGTPIRRVLDDTLQPGTDHRLYFELRDQGFTDYAGVPVFFSDGTSNGYTFTTRRPGGFTDEDITKFCRLSHYVGPVFQVHALHRTAEHLLETYLGKRTGAKVLRGLIKRGDGEMVKAILWFSDLRDFTVFAETLPLEDMLGVLNVYFETIHSAVDAEGGEVLDFIGDGMLAVFPCDDVTDPSEVAKRALKAARQSVMAMNGLNEVRREHGLDPIRFGIGLHEGQVAYGNVGAAERLNFGVIGAAVNRTARLESITKELGVSLLMSGEFARLIDDPVVSQGRFMMKGIAEPVEVFSLAQPI